jgi:hypothetical protein
VTFTPRPGRDAGRRQPPLAPSQVTRSAGDIRLLVARLL